MQLTDNSTHIGEIVLTGKRKIALETQPKEVKMFSKVMGTGHKDKHVENAHGLELQRIIMQPNTQNVFKSYKDIFRS